MRAANLTFDGLFKTDAEFSRLYEQSGTKVQRAAKLLFKITDNEFEQFYKKLKAHGYLSPKLEDAAK